MSIWQTLKTKPWLRQGADEELCSGSTFSQPREKIGLRFFLVVATALFFLFIVGYRMRMGFEDWRPVPEPWQLWLNTAMLILGSLAFQWARMLIAREDGKDKLQVVGYGLLAAGVFALAFLAGQLWVWQQLSSLGYFVTSNPASSFFYLITAVHGLHVAGGMVAWVRTLMRLRRCSIQGEGHSLTRLRMSVELCAIYWHYLLLVWLVLFYLLATT